MKRLLLIIIGVLAIADVAHAAPLADCAYATVNAAVAAASPGDTIELPSCVDTSWGGSTLSITKELILTGQGSGSTSLTNAKISVNNTVGETILISNFKMTGVGALINIYGGVTDFRVTGMYLSHTSGYALTVSGLTFGVIDNNTFSASVGASAIYITSDGDDAQYARASALGTANQVVVEDNYIYRAEYSGATHGVWSQTGGSWTARCNKFVNYDLDVHGNCSGAGSREFEIYGNIVDTTTGGGDMGSWTILRGGTGVIFDNWIEPDGSGDANNTIQLYEQQITDGDICQQGDCPCDAGGYPCEYQIGRGQSGALDPVYIWDNVYGAGSAEGDNTGYWPLTPDATCSPSGTYPTDYILENRDFYLDTTRPSYTPYTYPHPLRSLAATTTCLTGDNSQSDTNIQFWVGGPVISSGSPSSNVSYTATVTLSVATADNATCKYGTVAGTEYASIANTFATTGTTTHSQTGFAVIPGENTAYVRCTDGTYTNTSDYTITFTVLSASAPRVELGSGGTAAIGSGGTITIQ